MIKKGETGLGFVRKVIVLLLLLGIIFMFSGHLQNGFNNFKKQSDSTIYLDNDPMPYIIQVKNPDMCPCDDESDPRYAVLQNSFVDDFGVESIYGDAGVSSDQDISRISKFDLDTLETIFLNAKIDNSLSSTKLKDKNDEFESVTFNSDDAVLGDLCNTIDNCQFKDIEKKIVVLNEKEVKFDCFTSAKNCRAEFDEAYNEKHSKKKTKAS